MSFNKRVLSPGGLPFRNNENFRTVLYTGNGGTQSITGVGFKPDFVWLKNRSQNNYAPRVFDSSRGATKRLQSSSTSAESTDSTSLTSFDEDGFTLGSDNYVNNSGDSFVAWCWKAGGGTTSSNSDGEITVNIQANQDAGFSIATFAGISDPGEHRSFGHGLSQEPEFIWMKRRESSQHPAVFAKINGGWEYFDGTSSTDGGGDYDSYISTNSTVVDIYDAAEWFADTSSNYVYWMWHSVAGYSKIGTYTGTGTTSGQIVNTGFEPAFLMIKRVDAADAWYIYDNKRNTANPRNKILLANSSINELTNTQYYSIDFLSNGFQPRSALSTATNASGGTYLYMAFAENPDEESPVLSSSFNMRAYTGSELTRSITGAGLAPNWIWIKELTSTSNHVVFDTMRGPDNQLYISTTDAESANTATISSFDSDGWTMDNGLAINDDTEDYISYLWKADDNEPTINTNGSITSTTSVNANAGFSIVSYTGTGSNATVGHGLSQAPDWIIFKNRDASTSWLVYHQGLGNEKALYLESTSSPTDSASFFQDTDPTSTVFSVGTHADPNQNAKRIIAYCFHDVAGYSKFGSYTGNGSAGQTITTGFKPDFILIRSTVGTTNWHLYDTRRTRGLNQFLQPNNNDPQEEHLGNDNPHLTVTSTGFTITADGNSQGNNANGNLHLYMAFAKNVPMNTTLANSFNIATWVGNDNNTRAITGYGFRPDFAWIKRTNSSEPHAIYDSLRGENKQLESNSANAQATNSTTYMGLPSFDADGFSVGNNGGTNRASNSYIGWGWKAGNTWESNIDGGIPSTVNANTANGFSIVRYRGTGSATTVGHGLGAAPEMIIVKNISNSHSSNAHWAVYHTGVGHTKVIYLNRTNAEGTSSAFWNDTAPTSTVFSIGTDNDVNVDGEEFVAYCWDSISGFSSIGSYTGNGSSTGPTVTTGFKPDFVLIKRTDGTNSWAMVDSFRGGNQELYANLTDADNTYTAVDFQSNGFQIVNTANGYNANGSTYIYMAFAKNVSSNTTLENSFKTVTYSGTGSARSITGVGFKPDLVWIKDRGRVREHILSDSVRGSIREITSNTSDAEETDRGVSSFDTDGFSFPDGNTNYNASSEDYVAWCFKAGNTWQSNIDGDIPSIVNANSSNGFSIVKYHGNSASSATIGHGLSSAPQLIITKALNFSAGWPTQYNDGSTAFYGLRLNENGANDTSNGNVFYANTAPTSSVYTVGGSDEVNDDYDYIAYCWHSVSGFCKIGTYTGNGSTQSITGLGFQPDWLMIKQTNAANHWRIFDSARGLGNPQTLFASLDSQEDNESNTVSSFDSDGFTMGSQQGVNDNGDTYLYLAIKAN